MYPQCGFHIFPPTYYSNTTTIRALKGSNQNSQRYKRVEISGTVYRVRKYIISANVLTRVRRLEHKIYFEHYIQQIRISLSRSYLRKMDKHQLFCII